MESKRSRKFITGISRAGDILIFLFHSLYWFKSAFRMRKEITAQVYSMGAGSLPVVSLMAIFTGMVMGLQAGHELLRFQATQWLGGIVGATLARELGPVLTGLIVAGRVGAAMTAELGTMKVSEEIDALRAMAINPIRFLAVPRIISSIIILPLLTVYTNITGLLGGFIIGKAQLNVKLFSYLEGIARFVTLKDIWNGLIKSIVFGLIIGLISCYEGFTTEGGARGVGESTTRSVVITFLLVLIADYVVTHLLY